MSDLSQTLERLDASLARFSRVARFSQWRGYRTKKGVLVAVNVFNGLRAYGKAAQEILKPGKADPVTKGTPRFGARGLRP